MINLLLTNTALLIRIVDPEEGRCKETRNNRNVVHKAHAKSAMDSKNVKLRGYGNSKLWQENDYSNKEKTMQISWARDKEGRTGKCGFFGKNSTSEVTLKTTG